MIVRDVACGAVFFVAYVALYPGLTRLLFTAYAGFFGQTLVDIQKSTFGAIHLLSERKCYLAANTILICSVIMPFVKLGILTLSGFVIKAAGGPGRITVSAITFVRRISKWATVDAFTASLFVGFFCNSSVLQVKLHVGYYCFMTYCIFSTAGALLIDIPETAAKESDGTADEEREFLRSGFFSSMSTPSKLAVVAGILVLLSCLIYFMMVPIFEVQIKLLGIREILSLSDVARRLWMNDRRIPALSFVVLAVVLPALDFIVGTIEAVAGRSLPSLGQWLQDFAMLDVLALAVVVVANAANGVDEALSVKMLPAGWYLCGFAGLWLLYSVSVRRRQAPRAILVAQDGDVE